MVTSKIRVGISAGPRIWMASPVSELDFFMESGHHNPAAETSITIVTLAVTLFIMSNFVLILRRRKRI